MKNHPKDPKRLQAGEKQDHPGPATSADTQPSPIPPALPSRHKHLPEMIAQERVATDYRAVTAAIEAQIDQTHLEDEAQQRTRRRRIVRVAGPYITYQKEAQDYGWK